MATEEKNLSKSVEEIKKAYENSRGYTKRRNILVVIMQVFSFKGQYGYRYGSLDLSCIFLSLSNKPKISKIF